MATTNLKEQKKAERAKMTKLEKYAFCCTFFGATWILFWLTLAMVAVVLPEFVWTSFILIIISGLLTILFLCLSSKEAERERRAEVKRKESLIAKLNKKKFKEIKLKKSENKFFNAFLNNGVVQAKIHEDNDEIINVEFCFCDDGGAPHYKVVPFSKDYLLETIDDVIEGDND